MTLSLNTDDLRGRKRSAVVGPREGGNSCLESGLKATFVWTFQSVHGSLTRGSCLDLNPPTFRILSQSKPLHTLPSFRYPGHSNRKQTKSAATLNFFLLTLISLSKDKSASNKQKRKNLGLHASRSHTIPNSSVRTAEESPREYLGFLSACSPLLKALLEKPPGLEHLHVFIAHKSTEMGCNTK